MPKLNQLDDVGEVEEGTFSVEKVLSLKPDLLVLADWQYEMLGSDLDAINEAGYSNCCIRLQRSNLR